MEIFINYNVVYVEIFLKLLILNMKWMKKTLNVRIYQLVLNAKAKKSYNFNKLTRIFKA